MVYVLEVKAHRGKCLRASDLDLVKPCTCCNSSCNSEEATMSAWCSWLMVLSKTTCCVSVHVWCPERLCPVGPSRPPSDFSWWVERHVWRRDHDGHERGTATICYNSTLIWPQWFPALLMMNVHSLSSCS